MTSQQPTTDRTADVRTDGGAGSPRNGSRPTVPPHEVSLRRLRSVSTLVGRWPQDEGGGAP